MPRRICLFDHPGGITHALMGFVSPMVSRQALYATAAMFATYEMGRVAAGTKTMGNAIGNLIEFEIGVALFYLLGGSL